MVLEFLLLHRKILVMGTQLKGLKYSLKIIIGMKFRPSVCLLLQRDTKFTGFNGVNSWLIKTNNFTDFYFSSVIFKIIIPTCSFNKNCNYASNSEFFYIKVKFYA